VNATAATAIAFGPGKYSIDALLDLGYDHRVVAIVAVALGIVFGVFANATRRPTPVPASERDEGRRAA
jgi:hypothetical protein